MDGPIVTSIALQCVQGSADEEGRGRREKGERRGRREGKKGGGGKVG
jgi:hypothetical protein